MATAAKILIVDDEPNTLMTLRRALELEGHSVITAASVDEAELKLRGSSDLDLCLFDVQLPDGDGISLLERLGKTPSPPPVVMMSGHASIDDAVRALHLGARDFLEKPIGQDRLFVTIQNVLELSRLAEENERLRELALRAGDAERQEMLGRSASMEALRTQIERVAQSEGRVLITGENGTGKELIARALHRASRRAHRPFVSLNCAAVPAELIESELFGHERGAFTGAMQRKVGKFERAHEGTLFLDEVGDMPAPMQAKLLRVLQTGEVERVGGNETLCVDVRVVAATNKDLEHEIAEGRFREDLYYRLAVVPLRAPPLRDRRVDIPLLVEQFLLEAAEKNHTRAPRLDEGAMAALSGYDFPGNVRELRNLVERIVILTPPDRDRLERDDIAPLLPGGRSGRVQNLFRKDRKLIDLMADAEREIMAAALDAHDGRITEAARSLGLDRSNLSKKLKAAGLRE
jgi:DNA-binding NtrC family response regulator